MCDRDLIISKHGYLSIQLKTVASRGLRIILTPRGSSHTVNNLDLSKNKTEEKKNITCMKSIQAKGRIKAGIRKIRLNWTSVVLGQI